MKKKTEEEYKKKKERKLKNVLQRENKIKKKSMVKGRAE